MPDSSISSSLLVRVVRRLRVASTGRRIYVCFLALGGLYAVVLLTSRLLGIIPNWFHPATLVGVPVAAAVIGFLMHRRPTLTEAARNVDRHYGTKDLFLTYTLLEGSAGEYKPLVIRDADVKAPLVRPREVVPFGWARRSAHLLVVLLILLAGIWTLPQLDPFGSVEASEQQEKRREQLADSKKATMLRAEQLKRDDKEGEESKEVKKAIENLMSSFREMKKGNPAGNFKRLAENQKDLGTKWQKVDAETLKRLLSQTTAAQKFGGTDTDKLQKWSRELQQGSTESLQQELEKMQEDLKKLMKTNDPVERAKLEQSLKKKLRELEEFASKKVDSKPLAAALKRAMEQLEMAKFEGTSSEAREALSQSLELAKLELEEVQQSAKELMALEQALKVLQMAKRLNGQKGLDGEACEGCQSLADYEELYAQMMAQYGEGDGTGNEGQGRGGQVPEDETVKTDFKTEQSRSAVTAGKVLLSLKTKGLSDTGDAEKNYRELIKTIKRGVSEAILQEQIPPGYHEGIKRYFDTHLQGAQGDERPAPPEGGSQPNETQP